MGILSFLISNNLEDSCARPPLALPESWKASLCPGMTKLSFVGNSFLKNESSVLVVLKCSCSWKKSILQVLIISLIQFVLTKSRPVELYDIKLRYSEAMTIVVGGLLSFLEEPVLLLKDKVLELLVSAV